MNGEVFLCPPISVSDECAVVVSATDHIGIMLNGIISFTQKNHQQGKMADDFSARRSEIANAEGLRVPATTRWGVCYPRILIDIFAVVSPTSKKKVNIEQ